MSTLAFTIGFQFLCAAGPCSAWHSFYLISFSFKQDTTAPSRWRKPSKSFIHLSLQYVIQTDWLQFIAGSIRQFIRMRCDGGGASAVQLSSMPKLEPNTLSSRRPSTSARESLLHLQRPPPSGHARQRAPPARARWRRGPRLVRADDPPPAHGGCQPRLAAEALRLL